MKKDEKEIKSGVKNKNLIPEIKKASLIGLKDASLIME